MNEKLDIFILTHKNFKLHVSNEVYKVLSSNDDVIETSLPTMYDTIKENEKKSITDSITDMNDFYSELTMTYWLWKNYDIKDYIGICHYRRYYNFFDDVPNIEEEFKSCDIILPQPLHFHSSLKVQYFGCHNVVDLDLVMDIIKEQYPSYFHDATEVINGHKFYMCNMFIMKRKDFKEYCEFIFGVLNEYLKRVGCKTMYDIKKKVTFEASHYLKPFHPNNEIWYQMRIGGFLGERLLNIFVKNHFKNIKTFPIVVTEKKY